MAVVNELAAGVIHLFQEHYDADESERITDEQRAEILEALSLVVGTFISGLPKNQHGSRFAEFIRAVVEHTVGNLTKNG